MTPLFPLLLLIAGAIAFLAAVGVGTLLPRLICALTDHDHRTTFDATWCVRCGYRWPPR
jgi:hypothetical protein